MVNEPTLQLPKRTTPTWEMELLISGALVFSLLSLPAVLDEAMLRLLPRVSNEFLGNVTVIHLYLRCALFGLSGAFVLHLAIRAYWIALIGVDSVFPHEPSWDKALGYGKFMRESMRRAWIAMSARMEACDNAASLVFATGIALGAMMLSLSIVVLVLGVLSAAFGYGKIFGLDSNDWFALFGTTLLLPMLLAYLIDFLFGERIKLDGAVGKLLLKVMATQRFWPGLTHANAIYQTIRVNLRVRSEKTIFSLLVMLPMLLAILTTPTVNFGSKIWPGLFHVDEHSVLVSDPAHYRDQREGALLFSMLPFVASREIAEAAVELENARLRCPEAISTQQTVASASAQDLLRCTADAFAPTLDGAPLTQVDVYYSKDARSGLEGIVWRIPNAQFAPGKHVITIADLPKNASNTKARPPFQILLFR
jgi:hypothetical protein